MAAKKSGAKHHEEKLLPRPPIVAVLGHVDHGKTSLISKIHQIDLTKKEAGGISQHIGAYQIDYKGQKITFIDTPGHITFSQMRSRGATVADLVVLVVAADEGIKPQTLESLKHIQLAKVPYLVALNKIDLPNVNLEVIKKDLAKNNILIEGYGGDIVVVPVSAKTGEGIDHLLEMIILLGQMAELKANPEGELEAVVIESKMDQRKGPTATVLVRNGSLKIGEEVFVGKIRAKIKAMFDEYGKRVDFVGPSQPTEILGFNQAPQVGEMIKRKIEVPQEKETVPDSKIPPAASEEAPDEAQKLKIILKADALGTLEAVLGSLPDEVQVIHSEAGEVNESDVLLASTTKSQIIGFNIKISEEVKKLAETEGVATKTYKIIYELLEDIDKKVLQMIEPTINEDVLGRAEIIQEFEIDKEKIAGSKVKEGEISRQDKLHLKRGEKIIGDCRIKSMRVGKNTVEKVKNGDEFGVMFTQNIDFKPGDMLISYRKKAQE